MGWFKRALGFISGAPKPLNDAAGELALHNMQQIALGGGGTYNALQQAGVQITGNQYFGRPEAEQVIKEVTAKAKEAHLSYLQQQADRKRAEEDALKAAAEGESSDLLLYGGIAGAVLLIVVLYFALK